MSWLYFIEGLAFSATIGLMSGLTEALLSQTPVLAWTVALGAALPVWLAVKTASSRAARACVIDGRRRELIDVFRSLASDLRPLGAADLEVLDRSQKLSFSGKQVFFSAGSLVGLSGFSLVVPAVWSLVATAWAAIFLLVERRRLLLRLQNTVIQAGHSHRLRELLEHALRGMRVFRSLGAERIVEQRLVENIASTNPVFSPVPVIGFGVAATTLLAAREIPEALVGWTFLLAALFLIAQKTAQALVAVALARARPAKAPVIARSFRLPSYAPESVGFFQFRNLILDNGISRIGPLDLDVQLGQVQIVSQPDTQDTRLLLGALAGLSPVQSGVVRLLDRAGGELSTQVLDDNPAVPKEFAVYWDRRPVFLDSTIRENLVFSNPHRWSDLRLWSILERLGIDGMIRELGGLDAHLPSQDLDRSELLLLGLARALIPGRPLLVAEHPGFVGEQEWLVERLHRFGDFPATILGTVQRPGLTGSVVPFLSPRPILHG